MSNLSGFSVFSAAGNYYGDGKEYMERKERQKDSFYSGKQDSEMLEKKKQEHESHVRLRSSFR